MMRQYELVERVQRYDPDADEAMLNRAYVYAMKAHGNQRRASGAPYFSHPLEVAAILTDLKLDAATIATALLHDVIEDTDATRAEIDQLFGHKIGALVEGLTKIKRLDLVSKKAEQAESFRKLLIAISSDVRVLLVKLADRLHNMRTLEHMKPESRQRNSQETLDIYAPLAGLMGMQAIRDELEDHAFRWLHPEAYAAVNAKLGEIRAKNEGLVEEIRKALVTSLSEAGIPAEVSGREKKPYAIWSKMENKQISLEQLSDIYAFRVITKSIGDCYRVLGIVHTTWSIVPGRFKDYISAPKRNRYQSIHTTVIGPRHQRAELQIRTADMHKIAEVGIAAHVLYKDMQRNGAAGVAPGDDHADDDPDAGPYAWLRGVVSALVEAPNPEEFLEHTKLELFQDQVFCFTPKGRLIALPRGATPLDFAYQVHTDVGNAAVGAYINGRHMPIDTKLRNGDEVVIETAKSHTHPAAWEEFVVTGRARTAIRRAVKEAERRKDIELGRRMLAIAFEAAGGMLDEEQLKKHLARFNAKSKDDLLAAVGRDDVTAADVAVACIGAPPPAEDAPSTYKPSRRFGRARAQSGWFNLESVMNLAFRSGDTNANEGAERPASGISIKGLESDTPVIFEPGGAVPGDRIVGVMAPGEGIKVFQIHSPRLRDYEHEGWLDVTWDIDPKRQDRFPARISVTAVNAPGSLADVARVIGNAGGNIDNLKMVHRGVDFTEISIEVEVFDLVHLNQILSGLRSKAVVSKAERVFA